MHFRFSRQFVRMLQQVAVIGFVLAMVIGGTNQRIIASTVRIMLAGAIVIALLVIVSKRLRDAQLLLSPMDWGWLALLLLTGLTVALSQFPRRSLEVWVLVIGLQFPLAYLSMYLFRRNWPERAIYRALLVVGGCLFTLGALLTFSYLSQALTAQANGLPVPPFRLRDVLDNPSVLAMFIAVSVPCIVGYLFTSLSCLERGVAGLWLFGAFVATIANGTRSGTIAAFIGLFVALYLALLAHPRRPLARIQAWTGIHRLLSVVIVFVLITATTILFYVQSVAPGHADGSDRLEEYRVALSTFSQSPLIGLGTGNYVLALEREHSIPPFLLVPHAHNILLNFAADNGLLGIVGFLIFLVTAIWVCTSAWRSQPERRPILAGAIAGLVGFLASGLFELPINQPGLFFVATALLMFVASGLPAPKRAPVWRVGLILVPIIIIALISLGLLIPYSVIWRVVYNDFVMGSDNPAAIRQGAEQLDVAATLDPSDPLIVLQSAYVWDRLTYLTGDKDTLATSIDRLERGIKNDPEFGLHYINLSALYAQAGRKEDALNTARQAADRSYEDPVAWLNLGLRLEETSDSENAKAAYVKALTFEPAWRYADFWATSPVRQSALTQYTATLDASQPGFEDMIASGDFARASGQMDQAANLYNRALKLATSPFEQAITQGLLAWARGDLLSARAGFSKASEMGNSADLSMYSGDLAAVQGNKSEMIDKYSKLYQYIISRGVEGLGSARSVSYSVNSFWRFGLVSDYVHQVVILDISSEYAKRLKTLARVVSDSDPVYAIHIYRSILQSNPGDRDAMASLQNLQRITAGCLTPSCDTF